MTNESLRFGLIGAGFIGQSHGLAINAVNRVFGTRPLRAVATVLADLDERRARAQAERLGFERWTVDWREALEAVDAVIIAVPSFMHMEIAVAAATAGKHILCEKPVGLSSHQATRIAAAAAAAEITSAVGFTYLRAPMIRHAKTLLDRGDLGRPIHFRGRHAEDYLADADAPFSWRLDAKLAGRCGALGDLGWHIIGIARYLCGPISSLSGLTGTFHRTRPEAEGVQPRREVENEDWAGALLQFGTGAVGTMEVSRIAHGRKMDIAFELVCENGTLALAGERLNELQLYIDSDPVGESGFRTIHVNSAHPDYGAFVPAPAHGLGFNDLKTIELREFIVAVAAGRNVDPDLEQACRIARVCEAIIDSAEGGTTITAPEQAPGPAAPVTDREAVGR